MYDKKQIFKSTSTVSYQNVDGSYKTLYFSKWGMKKKYSIDINSRNKNKSNHLTEDIKQGSHCKLIIVHRNVLCEKSKYPFAYNTIFLLASQIRKA